MSNFLLDNFSSVTVGNDLNTSTGVAWVKSTNATSYGGSLVAGANGIYDSVANPLYLATSITPPSADYSVTEVLKVVSTSGTNILLARVAISGGTYPAGGAVNGYGILITGFAAPKLVRFLTGGQTAIDSGTLLSGAKVTGTPYVGQTITLTLTVQGTTITATTSATGSNATQNGLMTGTWSVTDATYSSAGMIGLQAGSVLTSTTGMQWTSISGDTLSGGTDTTAPVVASASVGTGGVVLTINFTETGSPPVLPASGATGFTLSTSGAAVTLSSAAISGTTFTATISRTILNTETLTLGYAPGNVTDSATTPNALATFTGTSVTNNSTQTGGGAAATAYTMTGPSTGLVGSASSTFTVTSNGTLVSGVVVTPSDGGKLGSFSPTSATLVAGSGTSATFTYTPLYYGSISITTTNSGGLANPAGSTYTTTLPSGGGGGIILPTPFNF